MACKPSIQTFFKAIGQNNNVSGAGFVLTWNVKKDRVYLNVDTSDYTELLLKSPKASGLSSINWADHHTFIFETTDAFGHNYTAQVIIHTPGCHTSSGPGLITETPESPVDLKQISGISESPPVIEDLLSPPKSPPLPIPGPPDQFKDSDI